MPQNHQRAEDLKLVLSSASELNFLLSGLGKTAHEDGDGLIAQAADLWLKNLSLVRGEMNSCLEQVVARSAARAE